ncbi:anaerobic carbon-monoxide dehydrogenase catalytic subunit [Limisalsivibrio acetivorans]|uniref:anaerobic carbon-monoxide dehydrogenase catalytic subunit n=1 Tax=Limisalsivibrio acetivorans TaxID=1304888 RepID=UPI0003B77B77|nr:anaerobic carbon-monoxide dehydrogenase catalytic subunit [Limisalsivibrio acetivorans]
MKNDKRSVDPAAQQVFNVMDSQGYDNAWSRLEKQKPQCGYGELGVCCKICVMGPCRIDPFGGEPSRGVCGADADTIVARNVLRMIAVGASAHSDHGRRPAILLREVAEGKNTDYKITDAEKLKGVAQKIGVYDSGDSILEMAGKVAEVALDCFSRQKEGCIPFADAYLPKKRQERFEKLEKMFTDEMGMTIGVLPRNIDREAVDILQRTHFGTDHDPLSLLMQGVRCSLSDGWGGSLIATELQDILFGTPTVKSVQANLGVIDEDYVNIVVSGHEPILSAKIVEIAMSKAMKEYAVSKGAKGVNVVGMCCTGNEILMRQGVSIAGNELHQELAVMTGAVEAVVVDVQCIFPSLADLSKCFHTQFISTSDQAKFPGAKHIQFVEENADRIAEDVIRSAVDVFPQRNKQKVHIPKTKSNAIVGFSVEEILKALGGTPQPLIDAIAGGSIKGVVGVVGCNNVKITQDSYHLSLTSELLKRDILVIGTGCWAIAAAKAGFMNMDILSETSPNLRGVCESLGIPPVLHMGSCVDCSRMLVLAGALADTLGVDVDQLPLVGSAPEWTTEKAVSIGTYFVASGIPVHLWPAPPVLGSATVTKMLTDDINGLLGAAFFVEGDPVAAADKMEEMIIEKRKALGLS